MAPLEASATAEGIGCRLLAGGGTRGGHARDDDIALGGALDQLGSDAVGDANLHGNWFRLGALVAARQTVNGTGADDDFTRRGRRGSKPAFDEELAELVALFR